MKQYDFIHMIRRIKKLPDNLLIQVLIAICHELKQRSEESLKALRDTTDKG